MVFALNGTHIIGVTALILHIEAGTVAEVGMVIKISIIVDKYIMYGLFSFNDN